MGNNKIRTMELIGVDDFNNSVYRCIETGILYKDIAMKGFDAELCTCGNDFYGEPVSPIDADFVIHFKEVPGQITQEEKLNYMLLSRLRSDCEYYLGHGNRNANHLWANNEKEQIKKMKELYNICSDNKKPEWLTYEQILQYEKLMISIK
ncbi:hypothetical protein OD350_29280 (plasmid) [Clostridium beijerinckii]|uniref:LPD11 domain-containing protein n=1 Tax=Clostridium beijerinckii TaxID=1520 RepID=UPI0022267547|nr:LPD11 domain-containing protein [Clostridium beijerinckii]UYZ38982.1 hypothetical protein OD350_29280 [Clostridium beijerinckii]